MRFSTAALALACGLLSSMVVAACGDDDDVPQICRFEPRNCPGGNPGAFCDDDRDCRADGFCCTDDSNCRGGMCSFECDDDRDCPDDMACEHDTCFFRCDGDEDCADGQSCEHGNTVCEWE